MCSQMVACTIDSIPLNVGHFVIIKLRHYKNHGIPMLMFPSLITELFKRVEVEKYLGDNQISSKTLIYPLKMHGEVTTSKNKKRKINLGKSVDDDLESWSPSSAKPFEDLSSQMWSGTWCLNNLLCWMSLPQVMPLTCFTVTITGSQMIRGCKRLPYPYQRRPTHPQTNHTKSQ